MSYPLQLIPSNRYPTSQSSENESYYIPKSRKRNRAPLGESSLNLASNTALTPTPTPESSENFGYYVPKSRKRNRAPLVECSLNLASNTALTPTPTPRKRKVHLVPHERSKKLRLPTLSNFTLLPSRAAENLLGYIFAPEQGEYQSFYAFYCCSKTIFQQFVGKPNAPITRVFSVCIGSVLDTKILLTLTRTKKVGYDQIKITTNSVEEHNKIHSHLRIIHNSIFMKINPNLLIRRDISIHLSNNGLQLAVLSEEIRDIIELVKVAVKQNGLAIQFASPRLQEDRAVATLALLQNGLAYEFLPEKLKQKNERHFASLAVRGAPQAYKLLPVHFKEEISLFSLAVRHDRSVFSSGSEEMKAELKTLPFCFIYKSDHVKLTLRANNPS